MNTRTCPGPNEPSVRFRRECATAGQGYLGYFSQAYNSALLKTQSLQKTRHELRKAVATDAGLVAHGSATPTGQPPRI